MASPAMVYQLLRVLGTPFAVDTHVYNVVFSDSLYRLALRNKVALSYLSHCTSFDSNAKKLYSHHSLRREELLDVLCDVCNVLNEHGFRHAVFKTLKPFEHVSVDLDILIHVDDVPRAVRRLAAKGSRVVVPEPYTVTLERRGFIVDLYTQPSFAWIVYMDGEKLLRDYVEDFEVNGIWVRGLNKEAEVVVTAAHAVYKENIVLLLDCLTLWKWYGRKVVDLAGEFGVIDSLDIMASTCEDIIKGAKEAPARIEVGWLIKSYLGKFLTDRYFRATSLNIIKYMLEKEDSFKILLWKIARTTY